MNARSARPALTLLMATPHKEDICYATTNRQEAVKTIAGRCEAVIVLGSRNSSNSVRLAEVARKAGAEAYLIDDASELDLGWLAGRSRVGITAGASAPEMLVQGVVERLRGLYDLTIEEVEAARETVSFKLPRVLAEEAGA